MATHSPFLICARCCSLDIEGSASPEGDEVMRCRQCGYQVPYKMMQRQIELALSDAMAQIHRRIAEKISLNA